jgi:hypothetical protein
MIAPGSLALSVPRMANPGVDEVTSRSPREIGPFSALTLHGTIPTIAMGISLASLGSSELWREPTTPGLV